MKPFYIFCMFSGLALLSGGCTRETAVPEPGPAGRLTISAECPLSGPRGTKAAVEEGRTVWTKDDRIGVFTSGHPDGNAPFVYGAHRGDECPILRVSER